MNIDRPLTHRRQKMPETKNGKKETMVTVHIELGPSTPARLRQFRLAYARLIASAKREVENDSHDS